MAKKKWYSYFVVTDEPAGTTKAAPVPARRVDEVAAAVADPVAPLEFEAAEAGAIEDVYRSARIDVPAHGYTVLKVAAMLKSEHIGALPPEVKRKSIMVALDAAGVAIDDIVQDAVRRDQALDTYERVLEKHLADERAAKTEQNGRLEAEIAQRVAELRARIDENTRELAAGEDQLRAWRARKQQEEATIAETIGYFVTENPITVPPAADKGDADVR